MRLGKVLDITKNVKYDEPMVFIVNFYKLGESTRGLDAIAESSYKAVAEARKALIDHLKREKRDWTCYLVESVCLVNSLKEHVKELEKWELD